MKIFITRFLAFRSEKRRESLLPERFQFFLVLSLILNQLKQYKSNFIFSEKHLSIAQPAPLTKNKKQNRILFSTARNFNYANQRPCQYLDHVFTCHLNFSRKKNLNILIFLSVGKFFSSSTYTVLYLDLRNKEGMRQRIVV